MLYNKLVEIQNTSQLVLPVNGNNIILNLLMFPSSGGMTPVSLLPCKYLKKKVTVSAREEKKIISAKISCIYYLPRGMESCRKELDAN